jgi:hypothetical protein
LLRKAKRKVENQSLIHPVGHAGRLRPSPVLIFSCRMDGDLPRSSIFRTAHISRQLGLAPEASLA